MMAREMSWMWLRKSWGRVQTFETCLKAPKSTAEGEGEGSSWSSWLEIEVLFGSSFVRYCFGWYAAE